MPSALNVIGKFPMNGKTCEVITFHKPDESRVDNNTAIYRGGNASANMAKEDGESFGQHTNDVPPEFWGKAFVFPRWYHPDDEKRAFYFTRGDDGTWHKIWYPVDGGWDAKSVLVRFS